MRGGFRANGEYEASKALHAVIPDNSARPVGAGVLASHPERTFYLAEFRDIEDELPPAPELAAVVAKLHKNSASPNGKFGFPVATSQAMGLENTWCDTWEEWFTRAFRAVAELEQSIQGHSEELEKLSEEMCSKVIPRLLRPMETGGRKLTPVLLHGDLWHGNLGVDMDTDQTIFFDCGCFYGHNECEFALRFLPILSLCDAAASLEGK